MTTSELRDSLDGDIRQATEHQRELTASLSGRTADLPLRYIDPAEAAELERTARQAATR